MWHKLFQNMSKATLLNQNHNYLILCVHGNMTLSIGYHVCRLKDQRKVMCFVHNDFHCWGIYPLFCQKGV